jgi:polyhydroxybutyrate depolymerase
MLAIETVVNWWVNFNQCSITPSISNVPNTNINDMCTAERFLYSGGINGSTVELFKVTPGAHTWPGAPIAVGVTNMDFNASVEIWRFFSQYSMQSLLSIPNTVPVSFKIYPNPAKDILHFETHQIMERVSITDLSGKTLSRIDGQVDKVDISTLHPGVYVLAVEHQGTATTRKLVID